MSTFPPIRIFDIIFLDTKFVLFEPIIIPNPCSRSMANSLNLVSYIDISPLSILKTKYHCIIQNSFQIIHTSKCDNVCSKKHGHMVSSRRDKSLHFHVVNLIQTSVEAHDLICALLWMIFILNHTANNVDGFVVFCTCMTISWFNQLIAFWLPSLLQWHPG